jgi:hypothetical protein
MMVDVRFVRSLTSDSFLLSNLPSSVLFFWFLPSTFRQVRQRAAAQAQARSTNFQRYFFRTGTVIEGSAGDV